MRTYIISLEGRSGRERGQSELITARLHSGPPSPTGSLEGAPWRWKPSGHFWTRGEHPRGPRLPPDPLLACWSPARRDRVEVTSLGVTRLPRNQARQTTKPSVVGTRRQNDCQGRKEGPLPCHRGPHAFRRQGTGHHAAGRRAGVLGAGRGGRPLQRSVPRRRRGPMLTARPSPPGAGGPETPGGLAGRNHEGRVSPSPGLHQPVSGRLPASSPHPASPARLPLLEATGHPPPHPSAASSPLTATLPLSTAFKAAQCSVRPAKRSQGCRERGGAPGRAGRPRVCGGRHD